MPSFEDVFLLNLLWEANLIPKQQLKTSIAQLYLENCRGKSLTLAQILTKLRFISARDLSTLQTSTSKLMKELEPEELAEISNIDIDKCHKQNALGKSSLGTTYKVTCPQLGACTLKQFEGPIAKNKRFLQRFLSHMNKVKRILHLNFARIYAIDTSQMLVLREFVAGDNLQERIQQKKMNAEEATAIILQASRGLEAANQVGLLHKNLKPENLIITKDGIVKVVDGSLPPTVPYYLAPEQCEKKKSAVSSDIYSLGIIFYQMLTQTLPFTGSNAREVMDQHCQNEYSPITDYSPLVPTSIVKIVDKMLAKRPENRYQDYSSLIGKLEKIVKPGENIFAKEIPKHDKDPYLESREFMHTTMMVVPSDGELAKKIAQKTIMELEETHRGQIERACRHNRFHEDLQDILAEARKKYSNSFVTADAPMSFFDEELQQLRNKITNSEQESKDTLKEKNISKFFASPAEETAEKPLVAQPQGEKEACWQEAYEEWETEEVPEAAMEAEDAEDMEDTEDMEEATLIENRELDLSSNSRSCEVILELLGEEREKTFTTTSRMVVPHPSSIPISQKPIPQFKREYAQPEQDPLQEEWGPGLKGEEESVQAPAPSFRKKKSKLVPYFSKFKTKESQEQE